MIDRIQEEIISTWVGDINSPKVTVNCMTFNHENYIGDALDSFLMQETNFPFEIVVHDDASTDGTKKVIEKYCDKFPLIIKPLYESENQHSKGRSHLLPIAKNHFKGKYVAFCEGDDFWTDKTKLQKQYDSLENNKNCYMSVHKTKIEGDIKNGDVLPIINFTPGVIKSDDFLMSMYAYNFHTSSFFFDKEKLVDFYSQNLKFKTVATVGDIPLMLYFGYAGDIYYISEFMSVYRRNNKFSWTARHLQNTDIYVKSAKSMIEMMNEFDIYSNNKYKEMCKRYIENWEFGIYFRTNNYKKLMEKQYNDKRSILSFSRKIVIYIGNYFPKIADFIVDIHNRIKKY